MFRVRGLEFGVQGCRLWVCSRVWGLTCFIHVGVTSGLKVLWNCNFAAQPTRIETTCRDRDQNETAFDRVAVKELNSSYGSLIIYSLFDCSNLLQVPEQKPSW